MAKVKNQFSQDEIIVKVVLYDLIKKGKRQR